MVGRDVDRFWGKVRRPSKFLEKKEEVIWLCDSGLEKRTARSKRVYLEQVGDAGLGEMDVGVRGIFGLRLVSVGHVE